jgi:hypothetical protein
MYQKKGLVGGFAPHSPTLLPPKRLEKLIVLLEDYYKCEDYL